MSSKSDSDQSDNFIDNSMNEYKQEASILYEDQTTPRPKKSKKKTFTKDDAIDQMRDLNAKLRTKLKDLNNRMERIVESIKYRLILDHTVTKADQPKSLKQRKFQVSSEIKALQKQLNLCQNEFNAISQ